MALIGEDEGIVGQVFEHGRRRVAGLAAGEVAGIVLDAVAGAGGGEHFEIVLGALLDALGLEQFSIGLEMGNRGFQLRLDLVDGLVERRAGRHIVAVRIDLDRGQLLHGAAGERVEFGDAFQLVAEEGELPGAVFEVGREDVDHVALHAERASGEGHVIAGILVGDELFGDAARVDALALFELERHRCVGLDRADAIDARDRGDDDHVVALEDGAGGRVAHPVNGLVDGGFLLDIEIGARHIGFGLVVIVIGHEILHRVLGEEGFELAIELCGERLVGGEDQGRALGRLDDLGHGEGLAGAGRAEQDLVALARADAFDEFGDRGALVARGLVFGMHLEPLAALQLDPVAVRPVGRPVVGRQGAGGIAREAIKREHAGRFGNALGRRRRSHTPRYGARAGRCLGCSCCVRCGGG